MRFGNSRMRTVYASLSGSFCSAGLLFVCLLFLAGCSGTGSSSQGGGAVYNNPSADQASPASQVLNNPNASKIVELFTNGIGGTGPSSTTPVDLPAEDLWLPDDGTVKLTMTVDGVTTVYTASARYGNFHFDIPAVPTGSSVSVRMDVFDSSGDLMLTGKASKIVQGATDTLSLNLASFVIIDLVPAFTADAWVWIVQDDPAWGWYTYSGNDPEYSISIHDFGMSVQIGGLALVGKTIYEIPTQTMIAGSVDSLTLTLNTARKFGKSEFYLDNSMTSPGDADTKITLSQNTSNYPALLNQVDSFYFDFTCTHFYYGGTEGTLSGTMGYADGVNLWGTPTLYKMEYTIKLDETTVTDEIQALLS